VATISSAVIETHPFGTSRGKWTELWWRWFLGNQGQDQHYDQDQDRPVYFVPGKWMIKEDKDVLYTASVIPQDKAILTPIDNWLSFGSFFTCSEDLKRIAIERTDSLVYLNLTVDGEKIVTSPESPLATRILSDVFTINLPAEAERRDEISGKTIRRGKYKVVSDGYWLFLGPHILDKGIHDIQLSCSCRTKALTLEAHHRIDII